VQVHRRPNEGGRTDLHLKIRYTDTGLHDIGQERNYGTGQTGWIYDMVKEMEERDQKPIYLAFL